MGSTSNGYSYQSDIVDLVHGMSENSALDFDGGLDDLALRRNGLLVYDLLEVPECNAPALPTSATDFFQIVEDGDPVPADNVPIQLLNLGEQEMADLLLLKPKPKVEGLCITAIDFIYVVKYFLYYLKVSENGVEGVPHPEATARLLCRLSRELKSAPSFESDNLPDGFSDPASFDEFCLGALLQDMEDYIKNPDIPSLPDGYVYVRRVTDAYVKCLLAAATMLNSQRDA